MCKLFKSGNKVVAALPKDAIEYLHLVEGLVVNINLDRKNRQIVITPAESILENVGIDPEFVRQVSEFIELYRPALEELAE